MHASSSEGFWHRYRDIVHHGTKYAPPFQYLRVPKVGINVGRAQVDKQQQHEERGRGDHEKHGKMEMSGYKNLALALTLSFLVMYPLTMIFVDQGNHFYINLSNAYMALLMVAPMGLIMMAVMRNMFPKKALNMGLVAGFAALFVFALLMGRAQVGVGNDQFLKAMIPHHSRAILVCENANITDPDIEQLCGEIVKTQEEEIATMEAMLDD